MKKIVSLLLIALLCVLVVGCSKKEAGSGNVFTNNSESKAEESSESKAEESSESKVEESSVEESSESSVEESSESSVEESSESSVEESSVEESSVEESEEPESSVEEESSEESAPAEIPEGAEQLVDMYYVVPDAWNPSDDQSTDTEKYYMADTGSLVTMVQKGVAAGADMHNKQYQESFISGFKGQFEPFTLDEEANIQVSGVNAYQYKFSGSASGLNVHGSGLIFCKDADMYAIVSMVMNDEDVEKYNTAFQELIDSIVIQ